MVPAWGMAASRLGGTGWARDQGMQGKGLRGPRMEPGVRGSGVQAEPAGGLWSQGSVGTGDNGGSQRARQPWA